MSDAQDKNVTSDAPSQGDDALKEAVLKAAFKDAAFDGFTENVLAKAGFAKP